VSLLFTVVTKLVRRGDQEAAVPVFSRRSCAAGAASLAMWLVIQTPASALTPHTPPPSFYQNPISMQAQEKAQWCWAASGNTIAAYHGVSVSQNEFCRIAGTDGAVDCANRPGTLADVKRAFGELGFSEPGNYVKGRIGYSAVQAQTSAGRPVQTRVGWAAGGGHMHVLYGYDSSRKWISWGDPLPSNNRYNWSAYDFYAGNRAFTWTHTLTGIRR
jgi:hypothetical protein